jgi:hypothetical protein
VAEAIRWRRSPVEQFARGSGSAWRPAAREKWGSDLSPVAICAVPVTIDPRREPPPGTCRAPGSRLIALCAKSIDS